MSSAKAATWLDLNESGRELAYRRNNMGPNMDPEGLPISLQEAASSLRMLLPSASDPTERQDSNQARSFPPKP